MMRRFYIIMLLVSLLSATKVMAGRDQFVLVVSFANGEEYEILMSERPVFSFDARQVTIQTSSKTETYLYGDIADVHFDVSPGETTGITLPTTEKENENERERARLTLRFVDNETVRISGAEDYTRCGVFGIDGRQVNAEVLREYDSMTVYLGSLPTGIYIIKTNEQAFKIRKK